MSETESITESGSRVDGNLTAYVYLCPLAAKGNGKFTTCHVPIHKSFSSLRSVTSERGIS